MKDHSNDKVTNDEAQRSFHSDGRGVPRIYGAIHAILTDLSKEGIGKDRKNVTQGYQFRGIDDLLNALAPLFAKHKAFVLPTVLEGQRSQYQSKGGGDLFNTRLRVMYTFYSAEDGSNLAAVLEGEAMDSGDKSTGKALSMALKQALIQTFSIPTEGDNDADATTHEVAAKTVYPTVVAAKSGAWRLSPVGKDAPEKFDGRGAWSAPKSGGFDPTKETLPFSKHKGKPWSEVPDDYLDWMLAQESMRDDTKAKARATKEWHAQNEGVYTGRDSAR